VKSFTFSNDPELAPKVRDVVELYINRPDIAIVLSGKRAAMSGTEQQHSSPL
jgi:hypothetical protein